MSISNETPHSAQVKVVDRLATFPWWFVIILLVGVVVALCVAQVVCAATRRTNDDDPNDRPLPPL